jgi:hypothetical protein
MDKTDDLHPLTGSPLAAAGTGLAEVTDDLDGNARDPATPTIGCYEIAFVADKTWNGSLSAEWGTNVNWTPSGAPNSTDNVLIPGGTPFDCNITSAGKLCKGLMIGNGGILTMTASGSITVFGNITIQPGGTLTNGGLLNLKGNLYNQN